MNEKKAILLMIFILHDGTTSRLLPPTNAIVNTTRQEDKFPLEKRSLNKEAPLKGNFDDMSTSAMNNLQNNHNGSERVQASRRLSKRHLGHLRHGDTISLKYTGGRDAWLSCWGSGDWCETRSCPGTHNPFERGSQYEFTYKCRGEVFWIYGGGRSPDQEIRTCDTVGLLYSTNWGQKYWLSEDEIWRGHFYRTRTCHNSFTSGVMWPCVRERFEIRVEGKGCGDYVQDRDAIQLKGETNRYVTVRYGFNHGEITAPHEKRDPWRLYIH